MHIEINAKALAAAATAAAKVAGRKSAAAPIYHHLLLESGAAGLTLTAVDDRVSLRRRVGVEHVHRAGEVCLPADTLAALAGKIPPAAVVTLEYEEANPFVTMSFGRARHAIPCLPADDFPPIATDNYEAEARVSADDIVAALNGCAPFAEREADATNFRLAGVHLRKTTVGIEAVAATYRHAARLFVASEGGIIPVTIPQGVVLTISGLLSGCEGEITIRTSETKIRFEGDGLEIVSRVVDAEYPPIDSAENALTFGLSVHADPAEIRSAMDRLKILAEGEGSSGNFRSIHLGARGDTLYVYASATCVEELTIPRIEGEASVTVNSDDLALLLGTVSGETSARFSIDIIVSGGALRADRADETPGRAFCMGKRVPRPEISDLY